MTRNIPQVKIIWSAWSDVYSRYMWRIIIL